MCFGKSGIQCHRLFDVELNTGHALVVCHIATATEQKGHRQFRVGQRESGISDKAFSNSAMARTFVPRLRCTSRYRPRRLRMGFCVDRSSRLRRPTDVQFELAFSGSTIAAESHPIANRSSSVRSYVSDQRCVSSALQ